MATILNPNPVTPSVFNGMWVQKLVVAFPVNSRGMLVADFKPYDGANLLTEGQQLVERKLGALSKENTPKGQAIANLLATLETEIKRLSKKTAAVLTVEVTAPHPTKPVVIRTWFSDRTQYEVEDAYALCASDTTFTSVFQTAMGTIATLAGLQIS